MNDAAAATPGPGTPGVAVRMSGRLRLGALLGGATAGLAGGLFGVGGGIVMVPLLTGAFRLTQHQAHGTSLAVIGFTALAALTVYGAFGNVDWSTAALVAVGSLATARYGARWASRLSRRTLTRSFAVFLVLVAARLFWETPGASAVPVPTGIWHWAFDLALGAAIGLLAGFMGVGGGILAVPGFVLILGMSQRVAQGTSLAVILVAAPAGAIEHTRHGNVAWRLVPLLGLGAAVGAPAASALAQALPREILTRGFALFLLANAIVGWIRSGRRLS